MNTSDHDDGLAWHKGNFIAKCEFCVDVADRPVLVGYGNS